MTSPIRREWLALKRGKPGQRFQDRYDEARRKHDWRTIIARLVRLVLAVVAVGIGVILVFIPGPAILFFFSAGGLLASESRVVAKLLDRGELMLRVWWKWIVRCWKALPSIGKGLVAVLIVSGAAGFSYLMWRVTFQ